MIGLGSDKKFSYFQLDLKLCQLQSPPLFASRSPEDGEHVLLLDQLKEVGEVEEWRELGAARA